MPEEQNIKTRQELLLSLPAGAVDHFNATHGPDDEGMFAASDPPGTQLGSGGGTAHLLVQAWRNSLHRDRECADSSFTAWLHNSRKLIIHGSGQSRRLPAYAAEGKPLVPLPATRDQGGQRPDQRLLDVQRQAYERFFWHAPESYRLMVTCGDVLIRFRRWLPQYPDVDVLIVGMAAPPEEAQRHGVMLCPPDDPGRLSFFLQKPAAEKLRELSESYSYYLDTGIWLLSARAISLLMDRCGWQEKDEDFAGGNAGFYDMYAAFGPSLGCEDQPADTGRIDPDIRALSCAVLPLQDARFYHFGTNRSLLGSVAQLQRPATRQRAFGHASMESPAEPVIQNSLVDCTLTADERHIWIENSHIGAGWNFSQRNVVTGAPSNNWELTLSPNVCLDFVPVGKDNLCLRFYGFDDPFRGAIGDGPTVWLGSGIGDWFSKRGITPADAGIENAVDIQDAKLFPVDQTECLDQAFIAWLIDPQPPPSPAFCRRWIESNRLSATDLLMHADVGTIDTRRRNSLRNVLAGLAGESWLNASSRLDLAATARICARDDWRLPVDSDHGNDVLAAVHNSMFRAAVGRLTGAEEVTRYELEAFGKLRGLIVNETALEPVKPSRNVLDDQIIWGRSPVRLDIAGGWTDTPPYCIEHGGRVVNVAVDLNGQPPIQVFARVTDRPVIVIRSIDLGVQDIVESYEDLRNCGQLGSGFGIARAALALAGLEPRFHADGGCASLQDQLKDEFGGGIEISMLAAVPKGSGLGTSSILAATLLGTLSELCGLYWDSRDLFSRTLTLEQMLTSGGGWQDQAGGIIGGLKLLETEPGLPQQPVVRWLPDSFFSGDYANSLTLLYYTGITRVAHDILGEIVRNIFLNSANHLNILEDIGADALYAADAIQRHDWDGLCEAVRRSWRLNQRVDSGTNPLAVQVILDTIADDVSAAKLLGAGGGGYMLILARDDDSAQRIRRKLEVNPPNPRARFVDMRVSASGFQITRS